MLFCVPLGLVPVCVLAGILLADVPRYVRREAHPERAVIHFISAWYVAGPVIVIAAFGDTTPTLSHWPVYVLALLAQFAFDFVFSTGRSWYAFGTPPDISARADDVCLARGRGARTGRPLRRHRRRRPSLRLSRLRAARPADRGLRPRAEDPHRQRARARTRVQGHSAAARRHDRGGRPGHRRAQPRRRLARPSRSPSGSASRARTAATPSSPRSSTTSARFACRRRSSTSPAR